MARLKQCNLLTLVPMQLNQKLLIVALSALLVTASQASQINGLGAPITNAALAGGTVVDFDAAASGTFASLNFGDLTISANGPIHLGTDYAGQYNNSGKSIYDPYDDNSSFTSWRFDFASGTNAFGFNWGASDLNWTLAAYDSSNNLLDSYLIGATFGSNRGEYFGLAASGISYATLSTNGGGDYTFIDNFTYNGKGSSVPDSSATLTLLALGAVSLAGFRQRKAV